jgi:hypothetical protein
VLEPQLLRPESLPEIEVLLGKSPAAARQGAEGGGDEVVTLGEHGKLIAVGPEIGHGRPG